MNDQAKAILVWILIGLIAGWFASIVVGSGGGLIGYIIAGLIGSVVGGYLARQLNLNLRLGNAFLDQVVIAFLGAMVVLIIARIIT